MNALHTLHRSFSSITIRSTPRCASFLSLSLCHLIPSDLPHSWLPLHHPRSTRHSLSRLRRSDQNLIQLLPIHILLTLAKRMILCIKAPISSNILQTLLIQRNIKFKLSTRQPQNNPRLQQRQILAQTIPLTHLKRPKRPLGNPTRVFRKKSLRAEFFRCRSPHVFTMSQTIMHQPNHPTLCTKFLSGLRIREEETFFAFARR